ncbi:MAG: STAS domain-containing protein [Actinomycetota bacterium]
MAIPILTQGPYLIASVQSEIDDGDLLRRREDLARQVGDLRARGLVIDVTAVDVMDSFTIRTLLEVVHIGKLRGAEAVIVGIQPEVAFAMVQLGLRLDGVATALDLEEGLALLERQMEGGADDVR